MKTLKIAPGLELPLEAVVHTFALLAMRGAGKSNAAVVMAEQMYDAGLHWVAIDPKGDWWGMRSARGGKGPGLPIPIFGGQHGDMPLEPEAGAYIADLVVDHTLTLILDLSEFSEGEKIRFLAGAGGKDGFAARLYKRKQPTQPPTHIFLEEADDYLPQRYGKEKAKLLHDCSKLLLWGRQRGIGGTAVSQRSARINKDVLSQTDNMFVLRTAAPQDTGAIRDWVRSHGIAEELVDSLPSLEDGEAWIWSPHWLKKVERFRFHQRRTFDSGSTPALGAKHIKPATLADVDLAGVQEKMAVSIERAKADDPAELRKRIQALEQQLRAKPKPEAPTAAKIERVEVPILKDSHAQSLERAAGQFVTAAEKVSTVASAILEELKKSRNGHSHPAPALRPIAQPVASVRPSQPKPARVPQEPGAAPQLGKDGLRRILIALAQCPAGLSARQLGVRAQLSSKSGTFSTYISAGRSNGWLEGGSNRFVITEAGIEALGSYDPLPTGKELLNYWLNELGSSGASRMLSALAAQYPESLTAEELGEAAEISSKSGTFSTYLSKLRTLELVTGGSSDLRASEDLI